MPPRYAYWTILIDNGPTAFRAREQSELLPTLQQLRRTNKDVVMMWFARGRLWHGPEEALAEAQKPKLREKRARDWRPGGQHQDPRERFKRKPKRWRDKPRERPHGDRPRSNKPKGSGGHRPWQDRRSGADRNRRGVRAQHGLGEQKPQPSPRREPQPEPRKTPASGPTGSPEQTVRKREPPE